MKPRPRYLIALALVATTLCADRLFASDQADRPETRQSAERLVARLTRSFSQAVRRVPLAVQQHVDSPAVVAGVLISNDQVIPRLLSPPQFCMPPPRL